jgi:hypothetical protein
MTQYFRLIAPHLRERLAFWDNDPWDDDGNFGKYDSLGGFLFDASVNDCFVYTFARPVIPLERDCDKEKSDPSSSHRDEPGIGVISGLNVSSRRRPLPYRPGPVKRLRSSPQLLTLPTELHLLIFNCLVGDIDDIFRLGLTCQQFWLIAKPMITKYFASFLGIWAGTPIICIGAETSVDPDCYPPGLLDSEDKDELRQGLNKDEENEYYGEFDDRQPIDLWTLSEARYEVPEVPDFGCFPCTLLATALNFVYGRPHPYPRDMRRVAEPLPSSFYPTDRLWILQNLTTREFVTSQAIALKPDFVHGPFIDVIGFGEVILSRVCWSTYNSVSMVYKGGIHQGVWAGHMLDIVPLDALNDDIGSPWKDISNEVAEEIAAIWKSEYGENWRDIVLHKMASDHI